MSKSPRKMLGVAYSVYPLLSPFNFTLTLAPYVVICSIVAFVTICSQATRTHSKVRILAISPITTLLHRIRIIPPTTCTQAAVDQGPDTGLVDTGNTVQNEAPSPHLWQTILKCALGPKMRTGASTRRQSMACHTASASGTRRLNRTPNGHPRDHAPNRRIFLDLDPLLSKFWRHLKDALSLAAAAIQLLARSYLHGPRMLCKF